MVRLGALRVVFEDGSSFVAGAAGEQPVTVRIHSRSFPRRFILRAEMVLGEAYMGGDVTVDDDDLYGLLDLLTRNLEDGNDLLYRRLLYRFRVLIRFLAQYNPVGRAERNVAHHYDLSNDFYELFLDKDRQYSCAYFPEPGLSLEEAQTAKKQHIARKLLLEPGQRVLDIGCGWGGMAMSLAENHGVDVTGVTLSREQHKLANERVKSRGLEEQVAIRMQDYRHVDETFDRIVSVGMFEHVGVVHYREFFRHLRERLEMDGVALLHTIGRLNEPGTTNSWLLKYIFPGGYVPALSEVMRAIEKENLIITDIEIWQLHYAETLRNWRERFEANLETVKDMFDERFCRMWRYYLAGCEVSFRNCPQVVYQIQLARKKTSIPPTRDYLYVDNAEPFAVDQQRANLRAVGN